MVVNEVNALNMVSTLLRGCDDNVLEAVDDSSGRPVAADKVFEGSCPNENKTKKR